MKYPQLVPMPSAVSDWLEEQLEARGIDAVVYTRYILSLLHTHTIDVIYPDEDLQFSRLRKEVGRSFGSRKRLRRTSDWWRHAQADAEQIKRSAAVECLMSASDQNCEIESLVDELCAKLKEVNSTVVSNNSTVKETPIQKISPKELAEKYYAAFPPLCPDSGLVTLIPKWLPNTTPKKSKKKLMKPFRSAEVVQSKRIGSKRPGCVRNLSREMVKWVKSDHCLNMDNEVDEEMNMYDDLPVDISGLLEDSPSTLPQEESMNIANMTDTGKNKGFISCGTNITSSIWSNNDQNKIDGETMFKFGSISIDTAQNWPVFNKEKEKKSVFEVFHGLPTAWSKNDTAELPLENEHLFDRLTVSLMKLNHCKETSGFQEVTPRTKMSSLPFNPFSRTSTSLFSFNRGSLALDKEDLLTSERSHFKPINEKIQKEYEDGATFVISDKLDKVEYQRSESGSMYLQTEFGQSRKYREYKDDESTFTMEEEFVLKYCVVQNDKACQTEDVATITEQPSATTGKIFDETVTATEGKEVTCCCQSDECCAVHSSRPDSVLGEVSWKYEMKSCDKCNNSLPWDMECFSKEKFGSEWDSDSLRHIWDGGMVCHACLRLNGGCTPRSLQNSQLRADISQDGEQLLSDLRSVQKYYMETIRQGELSYQVPSYEERKQRRPFTNNNSENGGIWSFASRIEEDCLISMSTLPTLRSVTL